MAEFEFPQRIVYMGHACDLTGMNGDNAIYTSIYSDTFVINISKNLFGYYEQVGLIERRS